MTNKDYYKILQVDPSAEPEVIAAAYRRLALKYHPDTNKSVDSRRIVEINEAYEVLSDPAKRREYDRKRLRETQGSRERQASATRGTESSTSGQELVYQSDFYHATDSLECVGEDYRTFCRDGNFHVAIQTLSDGWWQYRYFGTAIGDFRVSVEAQFATNTGKDSECGIVFRLQDDNSFHWFGVHPRKYYRLQARYRSGWKTLLDWRWSEHLNPGSSVNALEVKVIGSRIELSANGYLLTAVQDSTLPHEGWVGVFVQAAKHFAEARFRDFRLYSIGHSNHDYSASANRYDPSRAERQVFSRCPNCGAPLHHTYDLGFGPLIVQYCPICGWEG